MVGGGNYIEYQNLMEFQNSRSNVRVVYGCSTLSNSNQMMQQLAELGHEL